MARALEAPLPNFAADEVKETTGADRHTTPPSTQQPSDLANHSFSVSSLLSNQPTVFATSTNSLSSSVLCPSSPFSSARAASLELLVDLPEGGGAAMVADHLHHSPSIYALPTSAPELFDYELAPRIEDIGSDMMGLPRTPPGAETPEENAIPDTPSPGAGNLFLSTSSSEITHSEPNQAPEACSRLSSPYMTYPFSELSLPMTRLQPSPPTTLLGLHHKSSILPLDSPGPNSAGCAVPLVSWNPIQSCDSPLAVTAPPAIGIRWESAGGLIQQREVMFPRRLSLDLSEDLQMFHDGLRTRVSSCPAAEPTGKQSDSKKRSSPSGRLLESTAPRKKVATTEGEGNAGVAEKARPVQDSTSGMIKLRRDDRRKGRRGSSGSTWDVAVCPAIKGSNPLLEKDFGQRELQSMEDELLFGMPASEQLREEQGDGDEMAEAGEVEEEGVEEGENGGPSISNSRRRRSGTKYVSLLPAEPSPPDSKPPPDWDKRIQPRAKKKLTIPPASPAQGGKYLQSLSQDWAFVPDKILTVDFNIYHVKGQKGSKPLEVNPVLDYNPDIFQPQTPVWLRQHVVVKMLTEGCRTYKALVPDQKYKTLAVFAAIYNRVITEGPEGERIDVGQLAPAPAWEREEAPKDTFRDWVLNNLEGTLVFVKNVEAARFTLSPACTLTRNQKEAWIVESLLAGDCIIQVFNQKRQTAEEKLSAANATKKKTTVRNEKSVDEDRWLQMVPISQIDEVIQRCHRMRRNSKAGCNECHLGVVETFKHIQRHYYGITRYMVEAALKYCTDPKCIKNQHTKCELVQDDGHASRPGKPKTRKRAMTAQEVADWKEMMATSTVEAEQCLLRVAAHCKTQFASGEGRPNSNDR